jgi:hypothetical protein
MKLRQLTEQIHAESMEDEKSIDFSSVGLYLAGLQVCFAIVCCGCVSVLCCWLLPPNAISAVRTLAITSFVGLLLIRKPLRVGRVRGVCTMFNALRPAVCVYVLALVLEQLVHTCVMPALGNEKHGTLRHVVYHVISVFLIMSGFIRAKNPRSESDMPFLVAILCLMATALLPPPAIAASGPLCEPTSLLGAGERVLRALLFSAVYVVLVYAAAPSQNVSNELFICVARATAASIWVLSATSWALPLAPIQAGIVLFSRLNESDTSNAQDQSHAASYEQVPLNGSCTPDMHSCSGSDIEGGTVVGTAINGISGEVTDMEAVKLALASTRASFAASGVGSGGGLSFAFSGNGRATPVGSINIAAVAAREAGGV